jgi:hypothetical protein
MTVTELRASRPAEDTQPLKVVPKPAAPPPMNAVVYAHVHADSAVDAVRRESNGSIELSVGNPHDGAQVTLFLTDDAAVVRLIEALQALYPSVKS